MLFTLNVLFYPAYAKIDYNKKYHTVRTVPDSSRKITKTRGKLLGLSKIHGI
jgi:hypothetical protein